MSNELQHARPIPDAVFERLYKLARQQEWEEFSERLGEIQDRNAELWLLAARFEDIIEKEAPRELASFRSLDPPSYVTTRAASRGKSLS